MLTNKFTMNKTLELLKQRRVWAGIVGTLGFLATALGLGIDIDTENLTETLTAMGTAISALITGALALSSYFQPKK